MVALSENMFHHPGTHWINSGTTTQRGRRNGEAYDTDAHGNTLIFTAPDSSSDCWRDSAVQSSYGANEIIFCGCCYDPETQLYYVRARTYSPTLGRWLQRNPIGYVSGINLYEYVLDNPVNGLAADGTGIVDCVKALGDLALSTGSLARRTSEIVAHGGFPDQGHIKALQQATNRVEEDMAEVAKHCSNWLGVAAAITAAEAAIDDAAPYLIVAACCAA